MSKRIKGEDPQCLLAEGFGQIERYDRRVAEVRMSEYTYRALTNTPLVDEDSWTLWGAEIVLEPDIDGIVLAADPEYGEFEFTIRGSMFNWP